ncbi:MAG: hypothetical protein K2X32_12030 [Phycisphaerales bacterium]|nr:hypothetical protein [Phycisphaerales bacterium]
METMDARTLEDIHQRSWRLETGRRIGSAAMYSPVFFLVLMLGVVFNLVPLLVTGGLQRGQNPYSALPLWAQTVLTVLSIGLLASGPAFIVGVLVRIGFSWQLMRMARAVPFADLPPLPALQPGELLGGIIVKRFSGQGLVIKRRPAPAIIWWPFAWGLVAVFTAMTIAVVGNAFRAAGLAGALSAGGFMAIWWLIPLPLLKTMTLTVTPRADASATAGELPAMITVQTGIGLFLPRSTRALRADAIDGVYMTPAGLRIMPREGSRAKPIDIVGFSPGPLGAWQARRVGTVIEAMIRSG